MSWLHAVIDVRPGDAAAVTFWEQALGWPLGPSWPAHPELSSFEPPDGDAYVHRQHVDGPARVHIDVEVEDPAAERDRLAALGAQVLGAQDRWQAMASPGGLPFCLLGARDHRPPGPVSWPDGHRSRLVQVCVDAPVEAHEPEVEFWRAALRGSWSDLDAPEFAGKFHDDEGSPVQLLFQRLEERVGPVRAHLDLGTDDLDAEASRLRALGAELIGPGRGWVALRDPAGVAFCATRNSPEQTLTRDIGRRARTHADR